MGFLRGFRAICRQLRDCPGCIPKWIALTLFWCLAKVPREAAKQFARIADDGVFSKYGRLSAVQAGRLIQQKEELMAEWVSGYGLQ